MNAQELKEKIEEMQNSIAIQERLLESPIFKKVEKIQYELYRELLQTKEYQEYLRGYFGNSIKECLETNYDDLSIEQRCGIEKTVASIKLRLKGDKYCLEEHKRKLLDKENS